MRYRLAAGVPVEVQGTRYYARDRHGQRWHIPESITEPIPEEPEGPHVGDEVMAEWLDDEWDCGRYHVVRNPDGSAGSWTARVDGTEPVWKSDGEAAARDDGPWPLLALHPVERWEEPEANPTPPVDPVEEAWEDAIEYGPEHEEYTLFLRAAVEAAQAPLRDQIQALSDRVLELEEQIIDLRNRGETRAVRTVRTVAEKDAAGGEEGPKHQGPRWHQLDIGGILTARVYGQSDEEIAERVALLEGAFRAGQRDTRPVLTEEMVERAAVAFVNGSHPSEDVTVWMCKALLATGLVREAGHGE